jgi:predicted metal-dependent peptidase
MSFQTFTPREKIIKTKLDLNSSHPFFSYIILNMRIIENENCPSMAISEIGDLIYQPKFVEDLVAKNKDYLKSVLCHEAMHVAMLTFARQGNRDHMLWNMATDLAINWLILQEGFHLPEGCLLPDRNGRFAFNGQGGKKVEIDISKMCAEEIYDALEKHAEKIKVSYAVEGSDGDSESQNGSGEGGDSDGKSKDKNKSGKGNSNGEYKGQFDRHMKSKGMTNAQKNENARKWKQVTADATAKAKARGTLPAHLERILNELLDPEVDWRDKLRHFITKDLPSNFTYRMPARKYFSSGIYYPKLLRENIDVCAAIDVSGSIGPKEYNKFMSELMGIVRGFEQINLRVIYWATSVEPEDDISIRKGEEDTILTYHPKNSGGTTMSCVHEYIKEKGYRPSVVVYLTDGCVEGDPDLYPNSLVVVSSQGSIDSFKDKGVQVTKLSHEKNRD